MRTNDSESLNMLRIWCNQYVIIIITDVLKSINK